MSSSVVLVGASKNRINDFAIQSKGSVVSQRSVVLARMYCHNAMISAGGIFDAIALIIRCSTVNRQLWLAS